MVGKTTNTSSFFKNDLSAVLCSFLKEKLNSKSSRVAAKADSKGRCSPAAILCFQVAGNRRNSAIIMLKPAHRLYIRCDWPD
ncbi:hypothetical protein PO909_022840 [Leuciscus waleckii]